MTGGDETRPDICGHDMIVSNDDNAYQAMVRDL